MSPKREGMPVVIDPHRHVLVDTETGDVYEVTRDARFKEHESWVEHIGKATTADVEAFVAKVKT